jgi:hypothetical protein
MAEKSRGREVWGRVERHDCGHRRLHILLDASLDGSQASYGDHLAQRHNSSVSSGGWHGGEARKESSPSDTNQVVNR